jgi:hypothetical protein
MPSRRDIEAGLSDADKALLAEWERLVGVAWHEVPNMEMASYVQQVAIARLVERYLDQHDDPDFPERAEQAARKAACDSLGTTPSQVNRQQRQWLGLE